MADHRAGVLHWGKDERAKVARYLHQGWIDFSLLSLAAYMAGLKSREPIWERHPQKNFNQNVRRQCAAYAVELDCHSA